MDEQCYGLNVCPPPQKSHIKNLTRKVMEIGVGRGRMGGYLGHEDTDLMNVINDLTKEAPVSSLSPFYDVNFWQKDGQLDVVPH